MNTVIMPNLTPESVLEDYCTENKTDILTFFRENELPNFTDTWSNLLLFGKAQSEFGLGDLSLNEFWVLSNEFLEKNKQ